jgi:hypothetical protein
MEMQKEITIAFNTKYNSERKPSKKRVKFLKDDEAGDDYDQ